MINKISMTTLVSAACVCLMVPMEQPAAGHILVHSRSGAKVSKPVKEAPVSTIQYIEDKENGTTTTIAEDGTEYVCDTKHGIAFIRKDGVVLDELHLCPLLDDQSVAPVATSTSRQSTPDFEASVVGP